MDIYYGVLIAVISIAALMVAYFAGYYHCYVFTSKVLNEKWEQFMEEERRKYGVSTANNGHR